MLGAALSTQPQQRKLRTENSKLCSLVVIFITFMAAHFPLLHVTSVKLRTNSIFNSPSSAKLSGLFVFHFLLFEMNFKVRFFYAIFRFWFWNALRIVWGQWSLVQSHAVLQMGGSLRWEMVEWRNWSGFLKRSGGLSCLLGLLLENLQWSHLGMFRFELWILRYLIVFCLSFYKMCLL